MAGERQPHGPCGHCPWCVAIPMEVRVLEFRVNHDPEEQTPEELTRWVLDAYPLCINHV